MMGPTQFLAALDRMRAANLSTSRTPSVVAIDAAISRAVSDFVQARQFENGRRGPERAVQWGTTGMTR
jgi:hypothetical protein